MEFILAVPARRYGKFDSLLAEFHQQCQTVTEEVMDERVWQGFRLMIAHRPDVVAEQGLERDERIAALETDAAKWANKLEGQDGGQRFRGRKLAL